MQVGSLPELEREGPHFVPKRLYHLSVAPLPGHFLHYWFKYLSITTLIPQGLLRVAHS